ncbi:aminoacylase-1-like [Schistocerca americana]|uniref:aminoacylase-1-like n=1 Tax=Schistocerca americana TaxID=7009 RepID=UPI001F4F660E|nr:aminoacylase-1-like [Schistocerca americana]
MEVVLPTPPPPADDAKSPRRRHRRKKASQEQQAEEEGVIRPPPERSSEAESQASSVTRSVSADRSDASCVSFFRTQAESTDLEFFVHEFVRGKPVIVMKWDGTDPQLPAVMLNSHMDVVPASKDDWTHDPFGADMDEEGRIFARGAQDTKQLAIMAVEAVRRLKMRGVKLRRNVLITVMPDEEIGGADGMEKFVQSEDFHKLNVGFELDEGPVSPEEEYAVTNGERSSWKVKVRCRGFTGHGSIPVPGTPGEKLRVVLDRFMDFRQEELDKLQQDPNLWMADVTSTNLTIVEGGSALNVIPPEMSAVFDLRINPLMDFDKLEEKIWQWCSDAGEGVELEFLAKQDKVPTTLIGADNKWWTAFQKATEKLEMKIKPLILPATSDARFIRRAGIPALGFMPINNTPLLPHGIDEYITAASLLRGIDIFQGVLQEVANVL